MTAPLEPGDPTPDPVEPAPWRLDPSVAALLDVIETPVFVVAPDGTFLFINEASLRLIGSPAREQSLKYNAFRLPSMRAAGADALIRRALAGERVSEQMDYVSMWGRPIRLQVHALPLRAGDTGQVVAVACTLEHRPEEREIEQRLREVTAELKAARGALRAADALRSRVLAKVSHELRTPLLPLNGYLKLLEEETLGPLTEKQAKAIAVARRNAERLIELVEHTLQVTREGDPHGTFRPRRIEPDVLVQDALDAMAPTLAERDLEITTEIPAGLPMIRGSRAQLTRVLMTLLDNAQKFASDPGRVEIRAHAPARDVVVLDVSNTGQRIPPEERDRVFEPFYQVEGTEHIAAGGVGLGLSIAREVIEAHGGEILVLAEPHLDTTLRVRLPAVSPQPETSALGVLRVLLVGGPPDVRHRLETLLDDAGHDVRPVPLDGRLAERARQWPPDAIVVYLQAPYDGPLEAIGRLKEMPECKQIPVLGIRPPDAPHLDRAALDCGATATVGRDRVQPDLLSLLEHVQRTTQNPTDG